MYIIMAGSLFDSLFGPIDKSYCVWFYFLSVYFYIFFILAIIMFIMTALSTKKNDWKLYYYMFVVCAGHFLLYFQNRLMHSMCVGKFA